MDVDLAFGRRHKVQLTAATCCRGSIALPKPCQSTSCFGCVTVPVRVRLFACPGSREIARQLQRFWLNNLYENALRRFVSFLAFHGVRAMCMRR